jgi:ComF family protein
MHPPIALAYRTGVQARRIAITRHMRLWAQVLLDLLLPPHCPSCGEQVATQGTFCAACFGKLSFITAPLCTGCGLPFASRAFAGPLQLCPACIEQPPAWRQARAGLLYNDAARGLILPLKYADRQENAAVLAAQMARAGAALLAQADLLVPVPLHRRRLLHRGFNQAALLAKALSKRSGVKSMPDVLRRVRATPALGEFSATSRTEIMAGAVAVRPHRAALVAGRRILLIDDVMTSGATASSCARVLLDAGAVHIDVLVAARVPDPRRQ